MKNMTAIDTLLGKKDLMASGYALKQAQNFGREHSYMRSIDSMEKYKPVYYIVKADAKTNYGLDFQIWAWYTTSDGVQLLKEQHFGGGASMTSRPFQRVMMKGSEFIFTDEFINKEHRAELKRLSDAGYLFT
jgi:hypothetical protein